MKLLVIQTWHEIVITVGLLLESSLTNPEGYLVPASQGRSRGLALTQEVIIATLLVALTINTITIAPTSCMLALCAMRSLRIWAVCGAVQAGLALSSSCKH